MTDIERKHREQVVMDFEIALYLLGRHMGPVHVLVTGLNEVLQEYKRDFIERSRCCSAQTESSDRQASTHDSAVDSGATADENTAAEPRSIVRYGLEENDRPNRTAAVRTHFGLRGRKP